MFKVDRIKKLVQGHLIEDSIVLCTIQMKYHGTRFLKLDLLLPPKVM